MFSNQMSIDLRAVDLSRPFDVKIDGADRLQALAYARTARRHLHAALPSHVIKLDLNSKGSVAVVHVLPPSAGTSLVSSMIRGALAPSFGVLAAAVANYRRG